MCVKTLRESKFKRKNLNSESDTVLGKKKKIDFPYTKGIFTGI